MVHFFDIVFTHDYLRFLPLGQYNSCERNLICRCTKNLFSKNQQHARVVTLDHNILMLGFLL